MRRATMSVEERIDDLIEAGWGVLDSDFDPVAFHLGDAGLSIV
jgi:hypothetical protein